MSKCPAEMSNVTHNIHDFWPHAMDVTKDGKTTCSGQETCKPVYLFYARECFFELYYSECLSVDLIFDGKLEETAVYSPSYWSESGLIHLSSDNLWV